MVDERKRNVRLCEKRKKYCCSDNCTELDRINCILDEESYSYIIDKASFGSHKRTFREDEAEIVRELLFQIKKDFNAFYNS